MYWILEKESNPFQLSDTCLRDMVVDHVLNQAEVSDEDGELGDLVGEIPLEAFAAMTKTINEKLAEKIYWPNTNIRLIP